MKPDIQGFRDSPKLTPTGEIYQGRLTCPGVQWVGSGPDSIATFTISAEILADAAESKLLWTDQDVQRGVRPGAEPPPARELCLSEGYPDAKQYIFDIPKADEITEKLLAGEKLFLSPLVWNLRPGTFEAYWDDSAKKIFLYSGQIYLPDSHHRQQALLRAVRACREAPDEYPKFSIAREFKLELYFLSKGDEGNYFFDKNQLPKPVALSKAYDLTTVDGLSLLARRVIDVSDSLRGNVNRVTDRLTNTNPQVITLSTLREMMKQVAPSESMDETELIGVASVAATFFDMLVRVRRELGKLDVAERRAIRLRSLVDSAVMMHGYGALMKDFHEAIGKKGLRNAESEWKRKLDRLSKENRYGYDAWSGDLFDKANPLWARAGVVKPGRESSRPTVINSGAARLACGRVLRQLLSVEPPTRDLKFLVAT